jgi:AraC-like DNA-binding protein
MQTFPQPHVGAVALGGELSTHVAALGWMDATPQGRGEHLVLPIDLYMLTLQPGTDAGTGPQLQLAPLRRRAGRFLSQGRDRLAYALLTPSGLMRLLREPLDGTPAARIDLGERLSRDGRASLLHRLAATRTAAQRAQALGAWLDDRLRQRRASAVADRVAAAAAALATDAADTATATALARARAVVGVSSRQIERDFDRWLGTSMAHYARLVRFQRAAQCAASGQSLADVAAQQAYTDQAHMTHAFRGYSTLTPGMLAALAAQPKRLLERRALAGRVLVVDAVPQPAPGRRLP